jgi:hypothetical protein
MARSSSGVKGPMARSSRSWLTQLSGVERSREETYGVGMAAHCERGPVRAGLAGQRAEHGSTADAHRSRQLLPVRPGRPAAISCHLAAPWAATRRRSCSSSCARGCQRGRAGGRGRRDLRGDAKRPRLHHPCPYVARGRAAGHEALPPARKIGSAPLPSKRGRRPPWTPGSGPWRGAPGPCRPRPPRRWTPRSQWCPGYRCNTRAGAHGEAPWWRVHCPTLAGLNMWMTVVVAEQGSEAQHSSNAHEAREQPSLRTTYSTLAVPPTGPAKALHLQHCARESLSVADAASGGQDAGRHRQGVLG